MGCGIILRDLCQEGVCQKTFDDDRRRREERQTSQTRCGAGTRQSVRLSVRASL